MVAAPSSGRRKPGHPRRGWRRRWNIAVRRYREAESSWVVLLVVATLLIAVGHLEEFPYVVTGTFVIPLVVANIVLSPRKLPWFVAFVVTVLLAVVVVTADNLMNARRLGGLLATLAVGLVILVASYRRSRLGVAGALGESMLVDLRDRISKQGRLPTLPGDWYAESVMRSAGGSSFAGDFMVASLAQDRRSFQVVMVDVSGKGEQAGTRALLLSGAFGGLLGALPAAGFLPAANDYLLRQEWLEGFATAVHLSIDLRTGDYEVRSAGHPPAVQLSAGSGRWSVLECEGPVLGLLPDAEFTVRRGRLQRGDAMLLFTDGLVETPRRDISQGIDRLLGQGERLLRNGFENGARRLIDQLDSIHDDRALMLLHRR